MNLLRELHLKTDGCVKIRGELLGSFGTNTGVRQKCPVSSLLLALAMKGIMEDDLENPREAGFKMANKEKL